LSFITEELQSAGLKTRMVPIETVARKFPRLVRDIARHLERRPALLVDQLLGQESTVIKPLEAYLHGCFSLAGATVGGDGRVRLVLDPSGLLENLEVASALARRATA
jgi:chemotaxis protein histidine kinase CheA